MTTIIAITYLGLPPSPTLNRNIQQRARELEQIAPDLRSCQVTVHRTGHARDRYPLLRVAVHARLPDAALDAGCAGDTRLTADSPRSLAETALDTMRGKLAAFVRARPS